MSDRQAKRIRRAWKLDPMLRKAYDGQIRGWKTKLRQQGMVLLLIDPTKPQGGVYLEKRSALYDRPAR